MRTTILTLGLIGAGGTAALAQFTKIPDYNPQLHPYAPRFHASCTLKSERLYHFEHRAPGAAPLTVPEQGTIRRIKGDLARSCNNYRRR